MKGDQIKLGSVPNRNILSENILKGKVNCYIKIIIKEKNFKKTHYPLERYLWSEKFCYKNVGILRPVI